MVAREEEEIYFKFPEDFRCRATSNAATETATPAFKELIFPS